MKRYLLILLGLLLIVLLGEGIYFYRLNKKPFLGELRLSSSKVEPGEYLVLKPIDAYTAKDPRSKAGYISPGKYFRVLKQEGSWLSIKMTRIDKGVAAQGWIRVDNSGYQLIIKD